MGMALGKSKHTREVLELDTDAQRGTDIIVCHGGEHFILARGKVRKIEMAVGINKHEKGQTGNRNGRHTDTQNSATVQQGIQLGAR